MCFEGGNKLYSQEERNFIQCTWMGIHVHKQVVCKLKLQQMGGHEGEGNIVWKLCPKMYSDLINQEKDNDVLPKGKKY